MLHSRGCLLPCHAQTHKPRLVAGLRGALHLPAHGCRLQEERQAAGIRSEVAVSLVSRGPILQGLTPYARRAFLPLLKVSSTWARLRKEVHACKGPGTAHSC